MLFDIVPFLALISLLDGADASPFRISIGPIRRPPPPFIPIFGSSKTSSVVSTLPSTLKSTSSLPSSTSRPSTSMVASPILSSPRPSTSSSTLAPPVSPSSSFSSSVVVGGAAPTPSTTSTILLSSSSSSTSSSSTVVAAPTPTVTDLAYIDTVLRHHNVHRLNHSAPLLSWSSSLAETARQIASSCVFAHNVTAGGGGYGQNLGAGYTPTSMGQFISEGLYNGEVNYYTYYGAEPSLSNFGSWGHFSQLVWKGTTAVGCYTYDCSATGLSGVPAGVLPYFSVCNYSPPGNYIGQFTANIDSPLGNPSVYGNYECPTGANCVGPTQ